MISYVGECDSSKPCLRCQGDCDDDGGCAGDLECFSRSGFEAVPGCIGEGGMYDIDLGADICISKYAPTSFPSSVPSTMPSLSSSPTVSSVPTTPFKEIEFVGSRCNDAFSSGKCEQCTGDCDEDSDCAGGMLCFKRDGGEDVPGCSWGAHGGSLKGGDEDFCKLLVKEYYIISIVIIPDLT